MTVNGLIVAIIRLAIGLIIGAQRDRPPPIKIRAPARPRDHTPPAPADADARNREAAGGSISGHVAAQVRELNRRSLVRELNRRSRTGNW